jgi:hypothetical protein
VKSERVALVETRPLACCDISLPAALRMCAGVITSKAHSLCEHPFAEHANHTLLEASTLQFAEQPCDACMHACFDLRFVFFRDSRALSWGRREHA